QAKQVDVTRPFVVIGPDNHLPYSPADLTAARLWLERLPTDNICQKDLADAWEQSGEPPDLVPSSWLDGGPTTTVTELREASPGISVLLEDDLILIKKSKDLVRLILPMPPPPKHHNWRAWRKHQAIPIAGAGTIVYERLRGAD